MRHFFGGAAGLVEPGLGPGVEGDFGVFGGWAGVLGFCGVPLLGVVLIERSPRACFQQRTAVACRLRHTRRSLRHTGFSQIAGNF
jgi:hypothetical protein